MSKLTIYTYVDWKKYVVPNEHHGITESMEHRGINFYSRVSDIINISWKDNAPKSVIAKIKDLDIAVMVDRKDYELVLKYCLKWFETQELYEYCAIIRDYLSDRKHTNIQKIKKQLI